MRTIGKSGVVKKRDYVSWPVFATVRNAPEFKAAFREIFDLEIMETAMEEVQASSGDIKVADAIGSEA